MTLEEAFAVTTRGDVTQEEIGQMPQAVFFDQEGNAYYRVPCGRDNAARIIASMMTKNPGLVIRCALWCGGGAEDIMKQVEHYLSLAKEQEEVRRSHGG